MKLHSYFSLHLQRYKINLQIYLHILNVYLHNVIFMGNSIFQGNIFIFLLIANHVFVQQFSSLHTLGIGRRQFLERSISNCIRQSYVSTKRDSCYKRKSFQDDYPDDFRGTRLHYSCYRVTGDLRWNRFYCGRDAYHR